MIIFYFFPTGTGEHPLMTRSMKTRMRKMFFVVQQKILFNTQFFSVFWGKCPRSVQLNCSTLEICGGFLAHILNFKSSRRDTLMLLWSNKGFTPVYVVRLILFVTSAADNTVLYLMNISTSVIWLYITSSCYIRERRFQVVSVHLYVLLGCTIYCFSINILMCACATVTLQDVQSQIRELNSALLQFCGQMFRL